MKYDKNELRKFGLRGGIVVAILGGICVWRDIHAYLVFLPLAAYNLIGALCVPVILLPLQKLVLMVVKVIGFSVTSLVMSFAFYCVFTPVGLCGRIFGKHFLDQTIDKNKESYWHIREQREITKESLEKQW